MKLGIISDCVHFNTGNGAVATENHILLRQLEELSSYFSGTLICCPFSSFDESKVYSEYTSYNISFIPLPNVGGNSLKAKLKLLTAIPLWFKTYRRVDKFSNIVYQRFPNNLNIPGFFYFYLRRKKVFATYTGTWQSYPSEPATYRFQRWLLKIFFKGPVWVYVDKPKLTNRIFGGFSPSYNQAEWREEEDQVNERVEKINKQGFTLFRLITVGTLIDYKNQLCILKACVILQQQNFTFHLTVVGDGPMRQTLAQFIHENNLEDKVVLAGKKNHTELRALYRQHDFVVQAPLAEGFGKVPVEGLFHGAIPVINNIAMAKHITGNEERGFLFDASEPQNLADKLMSIQARTELLPGMITSGRQYAGTQTLEAWAEDYYNTINTFYGKH